MLRSPAIQRALDARRATLAREAAVAGTPSGSNEIQEPSITPTGYSADALDGAVEFGGDVADGESTGVPQTAIRGLLGHMGREGENAPSGQGSTSVPADVGTELQPGLTDVSGAAPTLGTLASAIRHLHPGVDDQGNVPGPAPMPTPLPTSTSTTSTSA